MQKVILITGGAGFIGSNFVHFFSQAHPNEQILVVDKLTYAGNRENIADLIEEAEAKRRLNSKVAEGHNLSKRVRLVEADIAEKKSLDPLFREYRITAIVNFAAETHVDRSILAPADFVQTNIVGTHNLLELARIHKVPRFHQISTDEVYGDLGDTSGTYFTEQTPLAPNCPYAASKAAADLLVRTYFETYGMFTTISRCSNNYGPYQYPEKLIPYFFTLAQENRNLPLYGDGKNIRDWLFVKDHCAAIDLILHKARPGEIYNIGGHSEKQNREIAHLILDFLDKPRSLISYTEDRAAHDRRYAMDPSKIERELGWKAQVNFEEGIRQTFEWYMQNREWSARSIRRSTQWWEGRRRP